MWEPAVLYVIVLYFSASVVFRVQHSILSGHQWFLGFNILFYLLDYFVQANNIYFRKVHLLQHIKVVIVCYHKLCITCYSTVYKLIVIRVGFDFRRHTHNIPSVEERQPQIVVSATTGNAV